MDGQKQQGGVAMTTIDRMIEKLTYSGLGASYSEKGKRNPVRDDTQNLLTVATAIARPARILELGTAFGLSGLCLLRGAPEAELTTIEFGADVAEQAKQNFAEAGVNTKVITGDAGEAIKTLDGRFDVVFIDHEKKSYLPHFLTLLENGTIGEGTLILADNVIDRRAECDDFMKYMEALPSTTIQTECGLLVYKI